MAWCLVKHRDNFKFTLNLQELYETESLSTAACNRPILPSPDGR